MKIEVKNVKVNLAFSEETICFKADLYVNGTKVASCSNDGHGGCTWYNAHEGKRELLEAAEAYAKTLPSQFYGLGEVKMEIESNLEGIIDQAVDDFVNAKETVKFNKKLVKSMECNIVFGVPNSGKVTMIGFNGKPRLHDMLGTLQGRVSVQKLVDRVKNELKEGEVILNTNLGIIINIR